MQSFFSTIKSRFKYLSGKICNLFRKKRSVFISLLQARLVNDHMCSICHVAFPDVVVVLDDVHECADGMGSEGKRDHPFFSFWQFYSCESCIKPELQMMFFFLWVPWPSRSSCHVLKTPTPIKGTHGAKQHSTLPVWRREIQAWFGE